jgi:hypothetical protein
MQMHNAGIDLATIRTTIEGKYRTNSGNITPTPPVPASSERR